MTRWLRSLFTKAKPKVAGDVVRPLQESTRDERDESPELSAPDADTDARHVWVALGAKHHPGSYRGLADGSLVVLLGATSLRIDPSRRTAARATAEESAAATGLPSSEGTTREVERADTLDGPRTAIVSDDGRARTALAGQFTLEGFHDPLFAGRVNAPRRAPRFVVGIVGADGPEAREEFDARTWHERVVGVGNGFVVAVRQTAPSADDRAPERVVHVYAAQGGRLLRRSVGLGPGELVRRAAVHARHAWIAADDGLFGIDLRIFDEGDARTSLPAVYTRIAIDAPLDDTPATVLAVLPHSLLVEHPRFGRVRPSRAPGTTTLAKGYRVHLHDVYEHPVGSKLFHAVGWTAVRDDVRVPVVTSVRRVAAPVIVSEPLDEATPRTGYLDACLREAKAHGFRVDPALARFLELVDGDPALEHYLAALDLNVDVRPISGDAYIGILRAYEGGMYGISTSRRSRNDDGTPHVDFVPEVEGCKAERVAERFDQALLRRLILKAEDGGLGGDSVTHAAIVLSKLGLAPPPSP